MEPDTQAWISGNFAGQKVALVILVKLLHARGVLNGVDYIALLKATFNDPDAQFTRQDYVYLRGLANSLEEEFAGLPGCAGEGR